MIIKKSILISREGENYKNIRVSGFCGGNIIKIVRISEGTERGKLKENQGGKCLMFSQIR